MKNEQVETQAQRRARNWKRFISPARFWAAVLILSFWLTSATWAQQPEPQTPAPQPPPQANEASKPEHTITPAEAEQLFRSVDEILRFVSKDTGLEIKHPVKRRLVSQEEVLAFLKKRMEEDGDPKRLERASVTLKKLGLLPRDFDLQSFLLSLLEEQVAGYYDPKTKTVNLLNWVDADVQKPVLAHELTHALQDQNFGLEKWGDVSKKVKNDAEDMARDEERTARQAVAEGQAMLVLLDYTLAPTGHSAADSPDMVNALRAGMLDTGGSPVYAHSPLFLRMSLIFAYYYGTSFIHDLLVKGGPALAYSGAFQKPPLDTRQVMHSEAYFDNVSYPQIPLADLGKVLGKDWERLDIGGFGEFDIKMLVEQWRDSKTADELAPTLRAGYYMTFQRKKVKDQPACIALILRMASPQDAQALADVYGATLGKRYATVNPVQGSNREWQTSEGLVKITTQGNLLLATESFDAETSARLREAMLSAADKQTAAAATH
ncbi:MAG TPA: hypothetical protein VMU24_02500 [Candidatus Acidoferrales bacterium]|nr:hypothetical protein [Candidatus Acidoferrales bacterium]